MNDLNKLCKSVQYSTAGNTCSCASSNFVVSLGVELFSPPACVCCFATAGLCFFTAAAVSHCNNFLCRQVLRRPLRDCCTVCLQLIEYECGIIEAGNLSLPWTVLQLAARALPVAMAMVCNCPAAAFVALPATRTRP